MNDHPLLSICIPTFNRSKYLKECLDSIIASARGYEDKIEIIISDNDSDDNTGQIAFAYANKCRFIKYVKNDRNIGAENNFYVSATKASGDYVWIFGDDDAVENDGIREVIKTLEMNKPSAVVCNYLLYSKDLTTLIKSNFTTVCGGSFTDKDALLSCFGISLSFISATILKKELFLAVDKGEYDNYSKYGLSFLYAVYSGMATDCRVIYVANGLIKNRLFNSVLPHWPTIFVLGPTVLFDSLLTKGYSAGAVRKAKNKVISDYVVRYVINEKIEMRDHRNVYDLLWKYYRDCWSYWLVCIPLIIVPGILLKSARKAYGRFTAFRSATARISTRLV